MLNFCENSDAVAQKPQANGGLIPVACNPAEKLDCATADVPQFTPRNPEGDIYLIIGGLGGFGLELALFLAKKGVRKIVLSSRATGLKNGLACKYLLSEIGRMYPGTTVTCVNHDFTDAEVVRKFVKFNTDEASGLRIAGFFNLGMVLADGLFNRMTAQQWSTPIIAKKAISENFDQVFCEQECNPDFFVTFSSVSAGLGNAGQTNYGYANSCLDTLIRSRNAKGLSGLSVQWGAIGDVGVLSQTASKKTGLLTSSILPQEIESCLSELEKLLVNLRQGVWSVYVTPKRATDDGDSASKGDDTPVLVKVLQIVGTTEDAVKDSATIESLGADSLQSMEIQTVLKLRLNKKMGTDKIAKLSVKEIREMQAEAGK